MLKEIVVIVLLASVHGFRKKLDALLAEVEETLPITTGVFGLLFNAANHNKSFQDEYKKVIKFGQKLRRDPNRSSIPASIELETINQIQRLIDSSRGLVAEDVDLVIAYELSWKLLDELLIILKRDVPEQTWTSDIFSETYILMKLYIERQVEEPERRVCIQIFDALMHPRASKANLEVLAKAGRNPFSNSVAVLKNTAERMHLITDAMTTSSLTSLFPLPNPPPLQASFRGPLVVTAGMPLDIVAHFDDQLQEDRKFSPMSIPHLMYDSEIIFTEENNDNERMIKLGPLISRKSDAMIFRAADSSPPLVIKYQCNCYELDNPVYDLYRDYWLQKEVNGRGISPTVYFMSPPAKFPPYLTPKIEFDFMEDELRAACAADTRGQIRYMVMGLIHKSVTDLMKESGTNVVRGLQLAISLIPKLKILHLEKRIIHGDVHPGNVVVLSADRPDDFGLIDYGKSKFVSEIPKQTSQVPSVEYLPFCKPATRAEGEYSFREDVSTALLTAATLINGSYMFVKCAEVEGSNFAYIFGSQFNDDQKKLLNQVLALASGVEADGSPDYDAITRLLIQVRDSFDARESSVPMDIYDSQAPGSSFPIKSHYSDQTSVPVEARDYPQVSDSLVGEFSVPMVVSA